MDLFRVYAHHVPLVIIVLKDLHRQLSAQQEVIAQLDKVAVLLVLRVITVLNVVISQLFVREVFIVLDLKANAQLVKEVIHVRSVQLMKALVLLVHLVHKNHLNVLHVQEVITVWRLLHLQLYVKLVIIVKVDQVLVQYVMLVIIV